MRTFSNLKPSSESKDEDLVVGFPLFDSGFPEVLCDFVHFVFAVAVAQQYFQRGQLGQEADGLIELLGLIRGVAQQHDQGIALRGGAIEEALANGQTALLGPHDESEVDLVDPQVPDVAVPVGQRERVFHRQFGVAHTDGVPKDEMVGGESVDLSGLGGNGGAEVVGLRRVHRAAAVGVVAEVGADFGLVEVVEDGAGVA